MKLENLIKELKVIQLAGEVERKDISTICYDSRKVVPNSIFVAIKGFNFDGHNFINDAISKGAKAVVIQQDANVSNDYLIHQNITKILVNDTREALARISKNFYENPSSKVKVIGVTGTNGKTTITYVLKSILEDAGKKVGLIGTINNLIGNEILPTEKTTPESLELNELLFKMVESKCEYCVMEVSSHALELKRVGGIDFYGAIFTNLTREHLDFHITFNNYFRAKKILFDNLKDSAIAIINFDDEFGKQIIQDTNARIIGYGSQPNNDYHFADANFDFEGSSFSISSKKFELRIQSNLVGKFNLYNITASVAMCAELGVKPNSLVDGVRNLSGVAGRFNLVSRAFPLKVIVDYAHTPDALQNTLKAIREILDNQKDQTSKVITVFGAGGNRDKSKRPLMGKVVQELSDSLIVTSDNPRRENPKAIINDILEGIKFNNSITIIENREEAIKTAIEQANDNDIVLIAGKGHETYQEIDGVKYYFSDTDIANKYLKVRYKN